MNIHCKKEPNLLRNSIYTPIVASSGGNWTVEISLLRKDKTK